VFIAACLLAAGTLLDLIAYLLLTISLAGANMGMGSGKAFELCVKISEILTLTYVLAAVVGYVFCMLIPPKHGSLGLAIAAIILGLAHLILALIFRLLPMFGKGEMLIFGRDGLLGNWLIWLFIQLLFSSVFIIFPLYLRAVSLSFKDRWNAQGCLNAMVLAGVYTAERLITFIMFYVFVNSGPPPSKALAWIF